MKSIVKAFIGLCSSLLAGVTTVPDPHVVIPDGQTVVWSPLFQATWDEMNRCLGGPPKRLSKPNPIMQRMDSFQWEAEQVMPDGSWKVWGGIASEEFLKMVKTEARGLLDGKEPGFRLKKLEKEREMLACFGLLNREVEFLNAFYRSDRIPLKFASDRVRFFGTQGSDSGEYGGSVKVLAFRPVDGSFGLETICKQVDDRVIFYMPPRNRKQDFATASHWVRTWRKDYQTHDALPNGWNDPRLHASDTVKVPYVKFDVITNMSPLFPEGRIYGNAGDPWEIHRAEQKTAFELHEKGARVTVEATITIDPFADVAEPAVVPRNFIFDRPFFVFLWRDKAEWPYLGVWVGNSSALELME